MAPPESIAAAAARITQMLGETAVAPRRQITRIVGVLGAAQALALAETALALAEAGGRMLADGSRPHTRGGLFFRLVKERCTVRQRRQIFGGRAAAPARRVREAPPASRPVLAWADRIPAARAALAQKGAAADVKITLVGRPGRVVRRPTCVLMAMESPRGPSLPRGLPAPPERPTTYTLYLTPAQWDGVAAELADPAEALVVEGWAVYDPELEGIAVFAMFVTTRGRRARRGEQETGQGDTGRGGQGGTGNG